MIVALALIVIVVIFDSIDVPSKLGIIIEQEIELRKQSTV